MSAGLTSTNLPAASAIPTPTLARSKMLRNFSSLRRSWSSNWRRSVRSRVTFPIPSKRPKGSRTALSETSAQNRVPSFLTCQPSSWADPSARTCSSNRWGRLFWTSSGVKKQVKGRPMISDSW
ncbi:hypothetical protein D3C87_1493410 [compost metagenome]